MHGVQCTGIYTWLGSLNSCILLLDAESDPEIMNLKDLSRYVLSQRKDIYSDNHKHSGIGRRLLDPSYDFKQSNEHAIQPL